MTEIIPNGEGPLVSIDNMPKSVLSAIISKLNEKSQKSTRNFDDHYNIKIPDFKQLFEKIKDEFEGRTIVSMSAGVTLILWNNQRHEFRTWEEFEEFDRSSTERTRSISCDMIVDILDSEMSPQRYRVQASIQNIRSGSSFVIGPLRVMPAQEIGVPPVPIHVSFDYSSFIVGKNLNSTVENWEQGLERSESKLISWMQKNSIHLRKILQFSFLLSSIAFCRVFVSEVSPGDEAQSLARWMIVAAILVTSMNFLGDYISNAAERSIDRMRTRSNITLTRGDEQFNTKNSRKNIQLAVKSISFVAMCLLNVSLSIFANWAWETFKSVS